MDKPVLRSKKPDSGKGANIAEIYTKQRSRVDFQVSVLTGLIVIISCYSIFFLNYHSSYKSMIGDLQDRALGIHGYLDSRIEKQAFYDLDGREDEATEFYQDAKQTFEWVKNTAGVRYLYTAKRTENGEFIYLVDGLLTDSEDFRHIGDLIEPECIPDMERAYKGKTILPSRISKTTWGAIFISYFPMHEGDKVIGVLGIEFDAERQYKSFKRMSIVTPIVIILFCMIAAVVAVKWFRRISNPSYRDIASTDFLTGLKNRNAFEIDLHNLDGQTDKAKISLVSIDLDDLKTVNDAYGHAAGDDYIRLCCGIIKECIRDTDILYRIGGDEFSIIMNTNSEKVLEELIQSIREHVALEKEMNEFSVSMSMGYAVYKPEQDRSLFDTLKRADARMYLNKKEHKASRE